jgi:hypothetical protein
MKIVRFGLAAAVITFSSMCHAANLDEYLGSWVHVKFQKYTLLIEKNGGDGFMVRQTMPSPVSGKLETKSIPAVFKDGMLQFAGGYGALAIDRSSGHLTSGNAEYKRTDKK